MLLGTDLVLQSVARPLQWMVTLYCGLLLALLCKKLPKAVRAAANDDAQAPAPPPHHALKLVTMKTPYGRSCGRSYGWCRFGLRKELQTCHPLHVVLLVTYI